MEWTPAPWSGVSAIRPCVPGCVVVLSHITEKLHATLIIVSDPTVTILQKTYAQGIAQVGKIAHEL